MRQRNSHASGHSHGHGHSHKHGHGHSHDHGQGQKRLLRKNSGNATLSSSIVKTLKQSQARNLALFLLLNMGYMFVEIIVGYFTNSIGLMSDAGHMLVDCSALFLGLAAMVVKTHGRETSFTMGFDRIEVLAGFINGIFLTLMASAVIFEASTRVFNPPDIKLDGLLGASIGGLLVNVVGLMFFHEHAGGHGHDDGHGHSHSSANMQGVFLHVLADLLGSVAVVTSSLLIQWYELMVADPICSILAVSLVILSVIPLLRETTAILLLRPDGHILEDAYPFLAAVTEVHSVEYIANPRIFRLTEERHYLSIQVATTAESEHEGVRAEIQALAKNHLARKIELFVGCIRLDELVPSETEVWDQNNQKLITLA